MKKKSLILSTGLAMFSMFFGSGNLVFPLIVGQMSGGHFTLASFGILLTGVFVPFLGILAMLLFDGCTKSFFGRLGKSATFWISLVSLSLMGPFGVLARCITVAHGAFKLILPSTSLTLFSLVSCLLIFLLCIRKSKIVPLLGTILTPILLFFLVAIAIFGMSSAPSPEVVPEMSWSAFKIGIFQGYQTMDLLAAFFFSAFIIRHLKTKSKNSPDTLPIFLKSSFIGAGILSLIYFALVALGAVYAKDLTSVAPQEMLGFIAQKSLGAWAAPVLCAAVALACFTTAIVLTSLFADFLKKEISKDKIKSPIAILITLAIAFFTSTLEFSGIAKIIGPILEVIYPALILLTVLSIFQKLWGWKAIRFPIALAFLAKLLLRAI